MKTYRTIFKNRVLCIATMHGKEKVLAPILEQALGVKCILPAGINTDALGTFSGEVERLLDPVSTARYKCEMAMKLTGAKISVASEGSFGPHPTIGFIACDEEILLFIDQENNLEIVVRELSTQTNHANAEIRELSELFEFAKKTRFPQHKLILSSSASVSSLMIKGIGHRDELVLAYHKIKGQDNSVFVQTDMRAMNNPSRMKVIKKCAHKLVKTILTECPSCFTPGFSVQNVKPGLPCELCSFPTKSTLAYEYVCKKCGYKTQEMFPHKKTTEEPTFCDICNP